MPWKTKFQSPTVIAASVASFTTLCITLVTVASALITTKIQENSAIQIASMENRRTILLELFRMEPYKSVENTNNFKWELENMIKAGVITDDDCRLRIGYLYYSSDCKPKSPISN
jgi:hypothetical protein